MINLQAITDKTAISLSALCAIHCVAFPLAVIILPSLAAFSLDDEAFHQWMLVAVVPASLIALTLGCKKHGRYRILITGLVGLAILALTGFWGHDVLGEMGEKIMTFIAACIIAAGHLWNHQQCRQPGHQCDSHETRAKQQ